MLEQLEKWMKALQETIFQLMPQLQFSTAENLRNRLATFVKTYEDPEIDENGRRIKNMKGNENSKEEKKSKDSEL